MAGCWVCKPSCDSCKPKYYTCPECGEMGSLIYGKCVSCGRSMTSEDKERGIAEWKEKRAKPTDV